MRLHHVQVGCPLGGEDQARALYPLLGLTEVPKPAALAGRGGCWFRAHEAGRVVAELHVGVEEGFRPARKAHPAFALESVAELEGLAERLARAGYSVDDSDRTTFEGYFRFHVADPFGNRVEVLAPRL
ncbi:MAG TPA: VOC family protein [Marmoricola sp.]|jgi:catechol 2,3-dioxygenase-like lactoylglutathione lyase family enzyme|nr:VOC family protein [Marmoricola sp.]